MTGGADGHDSADAGVEQQALSIPRWCGEQRDGGVDGDKRKYAKDRGEQKGSAAEPHVDAGMGARLGVLEGAIIGILAGAMFVIVPGVGPLYVGRPKPGGGPVRFDLP